MKNLLLLLICGSLFQPITTHAQDRASPLSQDKQELLKSTFDTTEVPMDYLVSEADVIDVKQDSTIAAEDSSKATNLSAFASDNWGIIIISLLVITEAIVRITPSEKDNSLLLYYKSILNYIIPNRRKEGGYWQ